MHTTHTFPGVILGFIHLARPIPSDTPLLPLTQAVVTVATSDSGFAVNLSTSILEPYPGAATHGAVTSGPGDIMMQHVKQV